MAFYNYKRNIDLFLISIFFVLCYIAYVMDPIPQSLAYHDFADKRVFFKIPYAVDVLSSLGFTLVGFITLYQLLEVPASFKNNFLSLAEYRIYKFFFLMIALTGIGSAYYHYNPNNQTLFWDRLPLSMAMMSIFGAIFLERVNFERGGWLAILFILIGAFSTIHWQLTEYHSEGDLRLYGLVQALPIVFIPLFLILYPSKFDGTKYLFIAILALIFARIGEANDHRIFTSTKMFISGHNLKHLFGMLAVYYVGKYIKKRKAKVR